MIFPEMLVQDHTTEGTWDRRKIVTLAPEEKKKNLIRAIALNRLGAPYPLEEPEEDHREHVVEEMRRNFDRTAELEKHR